MIVGMIIIVIVIVKEFFYKPEENYYEIVLPKSIKIPDKSKLDTIDFGEFYQDGTFKKVIFAGKVFVDNTYNYPTYANIFTIVMEE